MNLQEREKIRIFFRLGEVERASAIRAIESLSFAHVVVDASLGAAQPVDVVVQSCSHDELSIARGDPATILLCDGGCDRITRLMSGAIDVVREAAGLSEAVVRAAVHVWRERDAATKRVSTIDELRDSEEEKLRQSIEVQTIAGAISSRLAKAASPALAPEIRFAIETLGRFFHAARVRLLLRQESGEMSADYRWDAGTFEVPDDVLTAAAYLDSFDSGADFDPVAISSGDHNDAGTGRIGAAGGVVLVPLSEGGVPIGVMELAFQGRHEPNAMTTGLLRLAAELLTGSVRRIHDAEKLIKSESLMHEAERLASMGSWAHDLRTNRITWSQQLRDMCGIPSDETPSYESSLQMVPEEDRPRVLDAAEEGSAGNPATIQYRLRRRDGTLLDVIGRFAVLFDSNGTGVTLFGSVQDITERKRLDDALNEQRQLLVGVLENMQEAILACDQSGRLTFLNSAARDFRPDHELDVAEWEQHYDVRFSDGVTRMPLTEIPLYRALNGEHVVGAEAYVRRQSDGELRSFVINGQPLYDASGKPAGAFVVMHDNTEERQAVKALEESHRRTELIINAAAESICALDLDGRVVLANRAGTALYDIPLQDFIGRRKHDLVHHTRRDGTPYPWEECPAYLTLRDGLERRLTNERFWRADGTPVEADAVITPVIDGDEIVGVVMVTNDVTAQRAIERQLEQASRLAGLGKLAASVAHEFNNVLMAIQPFAEILSRGSSDERSRSAATSIISAVQRGKRISQDIRRFARPAELRAEPLDVREFLSALADDVAGTIPRNVDLRVHVPASPLIVAVDRQHLHQAFVNLVLNARDAIEADGTITLEAMRPSQRKVFPFGRVPDPERYTHLVVSDTGRGMSAETMQHIFEPLFTTKSGGTGLGLAIVHQVITRLGGLIFVESTLASGTAVHIFLPVAPRSEQSGTLVVAPLITSAALSVLLVEDDADVAAGIAALLEVEGFEVEIVGRGGDVEPAIEKRHPDVVVLDMGLPDMSGMDVFERIAARWKLLPVVFSTGHGDEVMLSSYLNDPRVALLLKPYDGETLARTVRSVVAAGRAGSE